MESLFEGMVLFDPTSSSTTHQSDSHLNHQSDSPPSPSPSPAADVSQPLDENLFSDLTLVTPLSPPTSPVVSTTKSITRQLSITRKKKRAAGLRIGYKKDDLDHSVVHTHSIPEDISSLTQLDYPNPNQEVESKVVVNVDDHHIHNDLVKPDVDSIITQVVDDTTSQKNTSSFSIELRFDQIRNDITENLRHAKERVDSVSNTRKDCIRRRRKAAEDLSLVSAKYTELERQLEEACEAEDFETADRLSDTLASADSQKEMLAVALRDADAECDAADVKMQGVLDLQIAAEEECASLLQRFAMVSTCKILILIQV